MSRLGLIGELEYAQLLNCGLLRSCHMEQLGLEEII